MSATTGLQGDLLREILELVSNSSGSLEALLRRVLNKTLTITTSDAGGSLIIFESCNRAPIIMASNSHGEVQPKHDELLLLLSEKMSNLSFITRESGSRYRADDHQSNNSPCLAVYGGRSLLWVPLVEGNNVIGVLSVESMRPQYYNECHQKRLEGLAAATVHALDRFLLKERITRTDAQFDMLGISPAFLKLMEQTKLAAMSPARSVLILGPRGSGKELTACALHYWSDRYQEAFVPVLATALTETLFIDELFGHERYAFTGAARTRPGKFETANGGTLFFDEIGDMPQVVQSALLRVLERGELPRIGRDLLMRVDVRVLAATNRDLHELMADGHFREDLYDRLNVLCLSVPPLKDRLDDVSLLASHFVRKYCKKVRRQLGFEGKGDCARCRESAFVSCASDDFYNCLQSYNWPGNVRELESLVIQLLTYSGQRFFDANVLPTHIRGRHYSGSSSWHESLRLNTVTRTHIERVMQMSKNNQSQAARLLGIPLSTLRNKMKRLNIRLSKE